MHKPHVWVLGATPEIDVTVYDRDRNVIVPDEIRLSIQTPTGEIVTVSGEDMQLASGYSYYIFRPEIRGWYTYEVWAKDASGMEGTSDYFEANGFEVVDLV